MYYDISNKIKHIWFDATEPTDKQYVWLSYNNSSIPTQRNCDLIMKVWDCGEWKPILGFNSTAANKMNTVGDYSENHLPLFGVPSGSPDELVDSGGTLGWNIKNLTQGEWGQIISSSSFYNAWNGNISHFDISKATSSKFGGIKADTFQADPYAFKPVYCKFDPTGDALCINAREVKEKIDEINGHVILDNDHHEANKGYMVYGCGTGSTDLYLYGDGSWQNISAESSTDGIGKNTLLATIHIGTGQTRIYGLYDNTNTSSGGVVVYDSSQNEMVYNNVSGNISVSDLLDAKYYTKQATDEKISQAVSGVTSEIESALSGLSEVATTGLYSSLSGTPDLSVYQMSSGLSRVATTGLYVDLSGKPELTNYVLASELKSVAFSGLYSDISGTPNLSEYAVYSELKDVAMDGLYSSLSGKPDLSVYALSSEIPTKLSDLENDLNFEKSQYETKQSTGSTVYIDVSQDHKWTTIGSSTTSQITLSRSNFASSSTSFITIDLLGSGSTQKTMSVPTGFYISNTYTIMQGTYVTRETNPNGGVNLTFSTGSTYVVKIDDNLIYIDSYLKS